MTPPRRQGTGLRFVALVLEGAAPENWTVHAVHPDHLMAQETMCGVPITGLTPRFQTINAGVQRSCHGCGKRLAEYRNAGKCP